MEIEEVKRIAKEIASTVVREEIAQVDQEAIWHEKGMRAMQEKGLAGLVVAKEHGGLGFGLEALAQVCEILGTESASMGLCFGMHCVGTAVLQSKATEYQIENYLKPIAAGKHITTLALSEPGTGAHFYFPQTKITSKDNGKFNVAGKKTFATNGGHADSYVVSTVAADDDSPIGYFSCVIVDKDVEGLSVNGKWEGMGMRGNSSLALDFDNIELDGNKLIGNQGDQIWYIFNVVAPYFLVAMAGTYIGAAQAAFDEAKNHLSERTYDHSGSGLAEVQILQHRLGSMWSELQAGKQLIYWAAREADSGGAEAVPALCTAKANVAGCAVKMVNEALTLCGGKGYRENGKLERIMRDVRAADVMSPTTDLLHTWTGRILLDQPILG